MKVFNSLGSNFSWPVALRALSGGSKTTKSQQLERDLSEAYGGRVSLTYKGRQALQLALENSGLDKGARVAINGFTCFVVYEAVERAGLQPVMVDISSQSLHFGVDQLQAEHEKEPIKAVIIQNTLGTLVDIRSLEQFSRRQSMVIIEDLAHSVGAVYDDGRMVGTVGDFTMLSFSQDKTLDAVAGGALIDRRHVPAVTKLSEAPSGAKLRIYPLLTHIIRSTYAIGLGRILHTLLKTLQLLARPMDEVSSRPQDISMSQLGLNRWEGRETEFKHRRSIAAIYSDKLPKSMQFSVSGQPVHVRYPLKVHEPQKLLDDLRQQGFYLGDTWYDAPIGPKKYMPQTNYQTGQCPNAEQVCKSIINLPTHQEISEQKANELCEMILKWQA